MKGDRSLIHSEAVSALVFVLAVIAGCSGFKEAAFERGVDLYLSGDFEDASKLLEASTKLMADNPDAYAWYAECMIATGQYEKAWEAAHRALELNPEHGFAHTVLGRLFDPILSKWERVDPESAWFYLNEAVRFDPSDGNAWMALIPNAQRRNDENLVVRADTMLIAIGFLTDDILNYNRWVLANLPPNAMMVTASDLETYPCLALQARDRLRSDVEIIDLRLLATDWYRQRVAERYSIDLGAISTDIEDRNSKEKTLRQEESSWEVVSSIISKIESGSLDKPLCFSRLLKGAMPSEISEKVIFKGAYYQFATTRKSVDKGAQDKAIPSFEIELASGSFVSDSDRSPQRRAEAERLRKDIGLK